jgi:threonine/homoserine/homoserine lactone efflux protein
MFGTQHFFTFLAAGIILNLTPGQDTMYILGRSIAQGRRAGILSALGISTGGLVHTLATALGLSAILASSAEAFILVKWTGAGYLVYLGVHMFMNKSADRQTSEQELPEYSDRRIYLQGFLTSVLNPKVALFFLAFLPQFVDPGSPHKVLPFLFLGGVFMTTGTIWCLTLAILSARLTEFLRTGSGASRIMQWIAGTVFIGLGIKLALTRVW